MLPLYHVCIELITRKIFTTRKLSMPTTPNLPNRLLSMFQVNELEAPSFKRSVTKLTSALHTLLVIATAMLTVSLGMAA